MFSKVRPFLILIIVLIFGCMVFVWDWAWNDSLQVPFQKPKKIANYLKRTSWKSLTVQYFLMESGQKISLERWTISDHDQLFKLKNLFNFEDVHYLPVVFTSKTLFLLEFQDGSIWEFYYLNNKPSVTTFTFSNEVANKSLDIDLNFSLELEKMVEEHLAKMKRLSECQLLRCMVN